MKGFRERPIDPPEPQCPRCHKTWWEDESDYVCPDCGGAIVDPICPCGWVGDEESMKPKCPHCGYDGSADLCVVCNKAIPPDSSNYGSSVCESCENDAQREAEEAGRFDDMDSQYHEELDRQTENECHAIEQGATSEEDIDGMFGGDSS